MLLLPTAIRIRIIAVVAIILIGQFALGAPGYYGATVMLGIESDFGDEFTAEILFSGSQVQPPSNNTGSTNSDMNWIMAKHYDENGNVISESKQFFDNAGGLLQTQTKVKYRKDASTSYTHVFASQPVRDALGRDALNTMAAPIDNSEFVYKPDFVRNSAGGSYDYRNFDLNKTNSPDPIGAQNVPGTLGWYYSASNNWEPYTPTTAHPYSRRSYYSDGTGNVKKTTGAGEVFKMGSGHEVSNYVTPVFNELNHYLQVRNKFFNTTIGSTPSALTNEAIQLVASDANGKMGVVLQDKGGKTLMAARPGTGNTATDINVNNTVILGLWAKYSFGFYSNEYGEYTINLRASGNGTLRVSRTDHSDGVNYTQIYYGPVANFFLANAGSIYDYKLESDQYFTVSYEVQANDGIYSICNGCAAAPTGSSGSDIAYFKIFSDNTPVTISGSNYTLYDMANEQPTNLLSGNVLNKGYYKLVANGSQVTLTYNNWYTNISYSYYNQLGQLVATIAPEGVKKLLGTGLSNYSIIDDVPFISQYEYDVQGRLVKSTSTDGGTSEMVYRTDGKIRFSQNAEQKISGRYSYTNYDQLGRPVESGEYQPDSNGGIQFNSDMSAASNPMRDILDNISSTGGLTTGTKTDVVMTLYDIADNSHLQTGYIQNAGLLGGVVSMTKKYSSIVNNAPDNNNIVSATWYNYDAEGKVVWKIQYIQMLGYKTEDYTYDISGRLVKKVFQKNTPAETFVHYYEYDAVTQNLWKVYTAKTELPADKQLQATYIYYLHGPLKRIELAGNLQGIDYTYTLQGALKAINNSDKTKDPGVDGTNGVFADAFGMVLDYFPGDYENSRTSGIQPIKGVNTSGIGTDSYAGNIKAMTWFSKKPVADQGIPGIEDPVAYVYQYDDKYQFTESTWGTVNFGYTPASFSSTQLNKETIKHPANGTSAYDANGNILHLQRTGATGSLTDRFTYNYLNTVTGTGSNTNYNTNKLQSVVNDAGGTAQTHASYTYDKLGQLTVENTGGATTKYIKYDVRGKVIMVARDAGFTQKVVEYAYDELGKRIVKKSYNPSYQLSQITWYVGDVIYMQTVTGGSTYGNIVAEEYEVQGGSGRLGVYYRQSDIYAYELNDHLGNVRAVVAKSGSTMEVRVYADYYPYGMRIRGADGYRYGYQGQYAEKDPETDWNAFELRMYDSRIARWLSVDPEKQHNSPYLSMGNNPLNKTDPTGGVDVYFDKDGNYKETKHDNWWHTFWFGYRGRILDGDGNVTQKFRFASGKDDVNDIKNKVINKIIFVKEEEIISMLSRGGAFTHENKTGNNSVSDRYDYILREGVGGGRLDFSFNRGIPQQYRGLVSNDPQVTPSSVMFLVDGLAHNHMNFGNFLFGAAGNALGYTKYELLVGAHYNSLRNPDQNGYSRQLDAADDQTSIRAGYTHGYLKNYYKYEYRAH